MSKYQLVFQHKHLIICLLLNSKTFALGVKFRSLSLIGRTFKIFQKVEIDINHSS